MALGHGWLALLRHSGRPLLCRFRRGAYSLHKGPPGMVHGKWAVKHKFPERGMALAAKAGSMHKGVLAPGCRTCVDRDGP